MRPDAFTLLEKKTSEISDRVFSPGFRVTPGMRQKVEELAVWLAEGDRRKVPRATMAVLGLLREAARTPRPLN
jgi:hypothetical protein